MIRAHPLADPFTVQLAGLTYAEGKLLIWKAFFGGSVVDCQTRSWQACQARAGIVLTPRPECQADGSAWLTPQNTAGNCCGRARLAATFIFSLPGAGAAIGRPATVSDRSP